ncbi:MAG: disulfide bond formation protein B [Candidatus Pelagibacter sp.]
MTQIKYKLQINLILIFSILSILFAFYVEYILGHKPCNLCLFQRLPYILIIFLIILLLIFRNFERLIFLFLSIIFLSGALLALYHVGIEQGIFSESFVCKGDDNDGTLNKEKILKQLKIRQISCKDVTFTMLGVSLATINTFVSMILAIITFKIFIKYEKK